MTVPGVRVPYSANNVPSQLTTRDVTVDEIAQCTHTASAAAAAAFVVMVACNKAHRRDTAVAYDSIR